MKSDYIPLNVFKDKGLLTGIVISLLTHFFLLMFINLKEDKLLGDNYIPIEILDIKSPSIRGDSINESEKKINKNLSNTNNDFIQKSEEEFQKNIDDLKFNDLKMKPKKNKIEESKLEKNTSQQNLLENINKKRGVEKGKTMDKIETGSIKGKGIQKVTCLNCLEPKYPKLAIKRGYEGIVKLEILILKNGIVKNVTIKESTGFKILDQAGINAALNSTFYPLTKETTLKIEYTLKLN